MMLFCTMGCAERLQLCIVRIGTLLPNDNQVIHIIPFAFYLTCIGRMAAESFGILDYINGHSFRHGAGIFKVLYRIS